MANVIPNKTRSGELSMLARAARNFVLSLEDLLENIECASPKFWKEIESSRRSGKVSSRTIEKTLGL